MGVGVTTKRAQRQVTTLVREDRRLAWIERGSAARAVRLVEQTSTGGVSSPGTYRFDAERRPRFQAGVLAALWTYQQSSNGRPLVSAAIAELKNNRNLFATSFGRLLLSVRDLLPAAQRSRLADEVSLLIDAAESDAFTGALEVVGAVAARNAPRAADLWDWYERDAANIYALLEMATYASAQRPPILNVASEALSLRLGDLPDLAVRIVGSTARSGMRAARKIRAESHARAAEQEKQALKRMGFPPRPAQEVGAAQHGFVPQRLAKVIEEQPLNTEGLRVTLRGYQAFGARYALHQRRVLLGDEMGLGKTIIALAVMQHLANEEDARHFLVVAPNSVLHNWAHEIGTRTVFPVHILHGSSADQKAATWLRRRGVGITTFGTLRHVHLEKEKIPLMVVDEAHYVKNPNAQRTQEVQARIRMSRRTLFMTGTPMENRLNEFRRLAKLLDASILNRLPGLNTYSTEQFRAAAASIYLRRNQEDVLPELPELIEVDEWVSFTRDDHIRFEAALERSGNFIPLRYAAFPNAQHGGQSAKLQRLVEIVEEATMNGLKVAIYSEYHATIESVVAALAEIGCPTFGPITGAVAPQQRIALIRDLTAHQGGAALVAQIQAGGIGLNIQAASVVILCEPALKPSIEVQAIARSFRMGQTRIVQVHRLLSEEGIDQRIRALLSQKQAEFDAYVRHSSLAEASEAAMERELVGGLKAYAAEEAARRGVAS